MELFTLGIDLGKTTFHLVGMDQRGEVVLRKRFSRVQLLQFTANLKVKLIGMEACGGSHFLGRALREQGHEVRLIPAQYVKPYVRTAGDRRKVPISESNDIGTEPILTEYVSSVPRKSSSSAVRDAAAGYFDTGNS
jgi:transposase